MSANTNIGNTPVNQGYVQLIHTGETGGIDGTLRTLYDGDGTASDLQIASNAVKISTELYIGSKTITEYVQDVVGDMFETNGSHTNITATYDDNGDGAIDLVATGAISGLTEGTGVTITGTTNKTIAIGQSVGTSDTVSFGRVNLGSTDNSDFLTGNAKISSTGYMMIQGIVNETETGTAPAAIVFGNNSTYGNDEISLITNGLNRLYINSSGNITISQDLTISGDLQVNGTTTTVNQTNLDVSDNIIGLNRGAASNANDSGLIIERGSTGNNVFIGWKETSDRVLFGTTLAEADDTGDLTIADADIQANRLYGDVTGDLTGNVTGNVTGSASLNLLTSNNLSDLPSASTARTNLGVDAAGTDNSTDVTLAGTLDYITISGQVITRNAINLGTDVTGTLSATNIGGTLDIDRLPTALSITNGDTDNVVTADVIYDFVTGQGYGDMTGVSITASDPLDISQSNTTSGNYTATISLDASEFGSYLADMTDLVVGSTDELAVLDSGTLKRKLINEIRLTEFDSTGFDTGISFNGSTANGLLTYGDSSTADVEDNLTFTGNKLNIESSENVVLEIDSTNTFTFLDLYNDNTNRVQIGNARDGDFIVRTNDVERFTIDQTTGFIGMGTNDPTYDLDVAGDIGVDHIIYHNGDGNTYHQFTTDRQRFVVGSELLLDLYEDGTQDYVKLGDGGDVDINLNDDMFVEGSSGRVGIGTNTPESNLNIVDSGETIIKLYASTASTRSGIWFTNGSYSYGTNIGTDNKFHITGNINSEGELLTIDSSGLLGLGTTSPTSLLTTSGGDIRILGSGNRLRFNTNGSIYWDSSVGVKLENASTEDITIETNTSGDIFFNTGNTRAMSIQTDNKVFVGDNVQNQSLVLGGTDRTYQYLDTRDYMQHKGHFAESDWIVMESGANHVVTSYFDNTNVYVDGTYIGKIDSAFGQLTISSASLSLGSVISADRAVIVHQEGTIRSMCMNSRFSGRLLGSGSTRGYPLTIHIYAPYSSVSYSIYRSSSANVDITATALTTGTISQGGIITFTESDTASGTQFYVIEADGKVCATLDDGGQDHLLFTPLAMEVIASTFSREGRGGITDAAGSTSISETANSSAYYLKDTTGKYGLFAFGVADGSGSDSEFAMPIEFCSDYYIYGSTDLSNYRLVCFQDTFVKVLDVNGNVLYTHDGSSATKHTPLYFKNGNDTGGTNISTAGPFRFVGTAPFYLVCQEGDNQDEATMLGAMQHELSNNQRFKGGYVPNATTIDANLVVNDTNFTLFADSANNKVGIGESSLDANLHISGSPVVLKMDRVGTRAMRMGVPDNSSDFVFADSDDLKSNQRLELTGAGDVYVVNDLGVGVASPSAKLHVDEDDNVGAFLVKGGGGGTYLGRFQRDVGGTAYVDIHCGSDDPQITFTDSGASRQYSIGADSSFNGFKIAENSSIGTNDRFGINDSGQVLVGTSISNRSSVAGYAPIFQTEAAGASGYVQIVDSENGQFHGGSLVLHKYRSGGIVANTELGSIWFGGTDSANSTFAQGALIRAYAEGADSGSNVATNIRFFTNTGSAVTEAMRIESDQDVHFDQDVIAFSTTPSDKRLKTNINDINYGLDAVMKLSPKQYDWKKDNRHDIGFIAQEVEEVIPEIVKDKKHFDKQIKTLDYEKLTAVLIKAVQEQQEEINKLKEKLNG